MKFWYMILTVFVVFMTLLIFEGCATKPLPNKVVVQEAPTDILYKILSNKDDPDELRRILNGLLQNGKVRDRDHTSVRFADGSTLTTEKWFLEDAGKFLHAILFEQGIIIRIDKVEDKAEWEEIKTEPYGGWRKK